MSRIDRALIDLAPVVLAAAVVLASFVANAVPIEFLWRPLLIAIGVAVVVQAVAVRLGGWTRGSVWAFVALSILGGMPVLGGAIVFALALFWLIGSRGGREYLMAGRLAAMVAVVLVVAYLAIGARGHAFDWSPLDVPAIELGQATPGPSINVLLLDGYPRADVLAALDFDDAPFLAELERRGFDDYPDSHSNYDRTPFSVLTMLSMRHLADVPALWASQASGRVAQERLTARALLDLPLFRSLDAAGLRTRSLAGPVVHVPLGGASISDDAGTANNFELDLLQRSPLAGILEAFGFAAGQQRQQIVRTLAAFADPPDDVAFTFAHVMSPHAPLVFAADGSAAPAPPCYPATCSLFESEQDRLGWTDDEWRVRLADQISHLDRLVLDAIDALVERDPNAVIVIVSDHGVRLDGAGPSVMFRNLIVARTPGHPRLLGDHPTLINVLPAILDAYHGTHLPRLADSLHRAGTDPWLSIEDVAPDGP